MNKFIKFLEIRRSVRVFNNKDLPKNKLEQIVDAARFAATARNIQPWEFVVITDKEKLNRLAGLGDNAKPIQGAVACIAVFSIDTRYYLEDGSAATCNILLASAALGIGSCWIAGDKKPYAQEVCDLLGAPAGMKLVSLVALGYPKERGAFKIASKKGLKEVLHWEKF